MATQTNSRDRRLQELGGSDYEIADGEPDIRGWDVKDATGQRIGEVDELIFDVQSRKVRYMVIDLEGNVLDLETRDVLVPIGLAQLKDDGDDVILNNITAEQLRSLPDYDEDDINSDYEGRIRTVFGGVGGAALTGAALTTDTDTDTNRDTDFYNHEHFNDDNLFGNRKKAAENETIPVIKEDLEIGKREEERGGLRLRSRIVENPVEETVNLREENVTVERTPVNRAASEADLREDEIEVRESSEVPVVNKEARVVEEVSLNKEVTEREETIRDTVRETEVDIDKLGKNKNRNNDSDRM